MKKLLSKNENFIWSEHCKKSFEKILELLISAPVLVTPDYSKTFKLYVGASQEGIHRNT